MTNTRDRNHRSDKRVTDSDSKQSNRHDSRSHSQHRSSRPPRVGTPPAGRSGTQLALPLGKAGYIVFDIETTGGNPQKNGITEIYAIKYRDGEILGSFYSMVNPGIPIPPIVRRMTGIDNKMVQSAPPIREVMPRFLDFIGDWILVSHNTIGDIQYLRHFAHTVCRHRMENFFLCTHLLVERLAKEAPNKSLHGLAKFFDLPAGKLHRAEADAHLTMALFNVLRQRLSQTGLQTVEQSIRFQGDFDSLTRLGWGVPMEQLADLPTSPGVFSLHDHDGKLMFLSSALHIAREVRKLTRFDQLPRSMARQVLRAYEIQTEPAPHMFAALIKEADGSSRERLQPPPYHYHHRAVQVIYLSQDSAADVRIGVGYMEANVVEAIGPINDRKIAHLWLQRLAQILGTETARDGVHIDKALLPLVFAYFRDDLATYESGLKSRRAILTGLLSPKTREMHRQRLALIATLRNLPLPKGARALLHQYGFAVARHPDSEAWDAYAIYNSHPTVHASGHGDWKTKLSGTVLARRHTPLMRKALKKPSLKPLTAHEAARSSAFLWWLSANQHLNEGEFIPVSLSNNPSSS